MLYVTGSTSSAPGSAQRRSEPPKQVMFSDGIRPGGDLTELDGSSGSPLPPQRQGRKLKRIQKGRGKYWIQG